MKPLKPKGKIVVISSPSGGGKTTICKKLINRLAFIKRQITATTRPPRKNERNGRDYYFLSPAEFKRMRQRGGFIETAVVYGALYGSPKAGAKRIVSQGYYCAMALDIQGARSVKRLFKNDAILVFVLPPSLKVLKQRLKGRGTDSQAVIQRRLRVAAREIAKAKEFDYIIVNEQLRNTLDQIKAVLIAERHKRDNYCNIKELNRWRE